MTPIIRKYTFLEVDPHLFLIDIYYFIEKNIVLSKQLNNKSKKNTILLLIYVLKIFFK